MTDLELKYKFFGLHLGQALKVPCMDTPILAGLANTSIIGYPEAICKTVEGNRTSFDSVSIEHCQLILKPLSDITKEDAISVAHIYYGEERKSAIELRPGRYVKAAKEYALPGVNQGDLKLGVADYLRCRGYALPYMGKDPFAEGWAVKA